MASFLLAQPPGERERTLGIHYYKKLLPQKFSRQIFIFALTAKVFLLNCFDVYSILKSSYFVVYILL